MTEKTNRRKANEAAKEANRRMLILWGTPTCLLLLVLCILVTNFSAMSSSGAKTSIKEDLTSEARLCINAISEEMSKMASGGATVTMIVEQWQCAEDVMSVDFVEALNESLPSAYAVVVTDMEGKGYASNGSVIDISQTDYYGIYNHQKYLHTMNDGITGTEAFISAVPVRNGVVQTGMIYMYTSVEQIRKVLPIDKYSGRGLFALILADGSVVSYSGKGDGVNLIADGNLLHAFDNSDLTDAEYRRLLSKIEGRQESYTQIRYKDFDYTVITTPASFEEWQFVMIIPGDVMEKMEDAEWADSRTLVTSLIITGVVFILMLLTLNIVSRIQMARENQDLETKADTDLLTGLSNKIATQRLIQEFCEDNPNAQSMFVILDIDNFKKINDTMGHAFGDDVLRGLGHQLRSEFRVTDIIGRTGGDEFILFLKFLKTDDLLELERDRIINFFRQFKAGGDYVKYSATASIGAAIFPRDAKDYDGLYRAADSALYEAKRRGKNQMVFFEKRFEAENAGLRKTAPIDNDGSKEE